MHGGGGPTRIENSSSSDSSFEPKQWPVTAGSGQERLDRSEGPAAADARVVLDAYYGHATSEAVRAAMAGPLEEKGPLVTWTVQDVAAWACVVSSPATAACFRRSKIDGRAAALLTERDLRELGIDSIAARKHLLAGLAALACPPPPPGWLESSLPPPIFACWSALRSSNNSRLFFYCCAYFIMGMVISMLGPTLISFANMFGTTAESLNFVFFFRGFGWVVSSLGSGWLFDHLPGHPLMFCAVGLMSLTTLVVPFAARVSKWLWGAVFFFVGVAGAAIDVGDNTMIAWIYGEKLGPFVQLIHFWFGIGALLSPLIVAAVLHLTSGSVEWAYWFFALICLPVIALSLLNESPARRTPLGEELEDDEDSDPQHRDLPPLCEGIELRPLPSSKIQSDQEQGDEVKEGVEPLEEVKAAFGQVEGDEGAQTVDKEAKLWPLYDGRYGPEMLDGDAMAALHDLQDLVDARRAANAAAEAEARKAPPVPKLMVILIAILLFFYCGTDVGYGSWVYAYAVKRGLADETTAAYITSIFWAAITAGRLLGVVISSKVPPVWMMVTDMVGCIIATIGLVVFMDSSLALWVATTLFGLAMGSIFASAFSYPGYLGLRVTASDTMVLVIGVAVGEMAIPGFLGVIFDFTGYYMLPWCMLGLCIMQLLILIILWIISPARVLH